MIPTYKIGGVSIDVTIHCLDADGNHLGDLPMCPGPGPIRLPAGCCQASQTVSVKGQVRGTVVLPAVSIATQAGEWVTAPGVALMEDDK